MLLIAVAGPVGSGKSTLLLGVARALIEKDQSVAGFIQAAGERPEPGRGADSYDLVEIPSLQRTPWAVRNETLFPPYRFLPGERKVPPAEVVIIDEIGREEVEGRGHSSLLDGVHSEVLILGVRDTNVSAVEERLGRRFDLVIHPNDKAAKTRLLRLAIGPTDWESIGLFGAASGGVEATLGTGLHAIQLPGRGQLLSTLQAIVLTAAAVGLREPARVGWVSVVSAGLKATLPSVSKVRPMVAIVVQGGLFALAIRTFGLTRLAAFVGGFLVGGWAMIQGILLQWLLVGSALGQAVDPLARWIADRFRLGHLSTLWVLAVLVLLAGGLTGLIVTAFWSSRQKRLSMLRTQTAPAKKSKPMLGQVAFFLPTLVVLSILVATGTTWEAAGWVALRAIGISLALAAILSLVRVEKCLACLSRYGFDGPAHALSVALRRRQVG
jgi:nucleoside-triphosphatase THEP1